MSEPTLVGSGDFRFEADNAWAQLPAEAAWQEAVGVAADSKGRVYVFNRGPVPIVILDRDGSFVGGWGEGVFNRPHGIVVDDEEKDQRIAWAYFLLMRCSVFFQRWDDAYEEIEEAIVAGTPTGALLAQWREFQALLKEKIQPGFFDSE